MRSYPDTDIDPHRVVNAGSSTVVSKHFFKHKMK